ncbi:MAG: oxidoreductase [Phycisphaeraceae bacterium]|nr:MAG: oxidoreductase [Phycisphaeraceae bacterium]
MTTTHDIPTRRLTRDGIDVSEIGCGLWAQGGHWGPIDDTASLSAIDAALDGGVTFFDTSDVYGEDGHSEKLLGKAMRGRRDRFVVGTKIGWRGYDGDTVSSQYTTVDKLIAGVESNLERLQTDHIDVIQCHIFYEDPTTPVFIEGFRRLKEQGKVRSWGVSTGDLSLIKTFNAHGDLGTLQIDYSILNRDPENEVLPYCREHGIGVIVRGPLAMGLLAGKFDASATFPEGDFRKAWTDDAEQNAQFKKDLATVEQLRAVAGGGRSMFELALKFPLAHDAVSTIIPGARNERQARSNVAIKSTPALSSAELSAVDAIVAPGGGRKIWPA